MQELSYKRTLFDSAGSLSNKECISLFTTSESCFHYYCLVLFLGFQHPMVVGPYPKHTHSLLNNKKIKTQFSLFIEQIKSLPLQKPHLLLCTCLLNRYRRYNLQYELGIYLSVLHTQMFYKRVWFLFNHRLDILLFFLSIFIIDCCHVHTLGGGGGGGFGPFKNNQLLV